MSIPKVIHYCWFGGGALPSREKKCIESWKKYCPDFEIKCWNEENFDVSANRYCREAYEEKKWAFVSDYVRLYVLYHEGGVYMDTDVELIKPIDFLLDGAGYMGYDHAGNVSTGLGFASEKGNELVGALLADYDAIPFRLPDGTPDLTPCPQRNMACLSKMGLVPSAETFMGIRLLPHDYLCPMDYYTGKTKITKNTVSIHHYCASWTSKKAKRTLFIKRIIGVKLYEKLYGKFLHKLGWLEW